MLLDSLRSKNAFLPGWQGVFLNSAWLIRKTLARAIRRESAICKGTVLDFGCGSRPYESLFHVEKYIGLDIESSGHPSDAKKPDIYYDGKRIPLNDASVDHVFSAEVFEHVFNAAELFAEIHRILKPGGTHILTCPFVWPLHEEPYDFARYTPYALQAMLLEAGFAEVRCEKHGHAVEVIAQLLLMQVLRAIPRVPIIGGGLRAIACGTIQSTAAILAKIIPIDQNLYFSNVVIATKGA
jgi:SAM-dependent methyltransferase